MARPRKIEERVLGPYPDKYGWRIVHVNRRREKALRLFATEEEARRAVSALRRELSLVGERSVGQALDAYEVFLKEDKQNKPSSVAQTTRKLRRFFATELGKVLSMVDEKRAQGCYDRLRASRKKDGSLISVDYHRNALGEARTFLKWCVKKGWVRRNPLEGVEGVGKRRHGKPQLRIDEARAWIAKAIELADGGEPGAVAAMVPLLMGLRASEVVARVARDVDDGGRLLWIPDSKTEAGRRKQEIPAVLQPYLRRLANGKKPDALLFGDHWRDWPRIWVQRICRAAHVPVVTAHGMRGLHSTLAVDAGITGHAVASALGHESFSTTTKSYAKPEALDRVRQKRALKVLAGTRAA